MLYPDPNDTVNIGGISGRVIPANPFALAALAAPASGSFVTGIFGAHVVAVDSDTGAVIAGTLGGCTCDTSTSSLQFDGSFDIERLPVSHNYLIYAEPLVGLAVPADFNIGLGDLCTSGSTPVCSTPPVDTNFSPRILPAGP